jgi:hypothetical protein
MSVKAHVVILHETSRSFTNEWSLCFQLCRYEYTDGSEQSGYRFIWRRQNNNLQGAMGQARIPSIAILLKLVSQAMDEGWGNFVGEDANIEIKAPNN